MRLARPVSFFDLTLMLGAFSPAEALAKAAKAKGKTLSDADLKEYHSLCVLSPLQVAPFTS